MRFDVFINNNLRHLIGDEIYIKSISKICYIYYFYKRDFDKHVRFNGWISLQKFFVIDEKTQIKNY